MRPSFIFYITTIYYPEYAHVYVTTLTCKTNIVTETVTRNISIPVDENLSRTTTGTSMTVGSQSHQEATCMIREALNTAKTKVRIGFWNVRTMQQENWHK